MFSNLRANNQVYVLHKDGTPYLEVGNVISVSAPMPAIGQFGQPMSYTVDVTIKAGDQTVTYSKLPSNAEIADWGGNGNLVVAANRDAMNSELQAMKQRSVEVLASVDYHKGVIDVVDKILQQVNPEYAEKVALQAELTSLKAELMQLRSELKGEKTST